MTTKADDLLFEIGTEELPTRSVLPLAKALEVHFYQALIALQIPTGSTTSFATPRRLAVLLESVGAKQPDYFVERKGPAITAAFDNQGNPTPAALGFAKSCGVSLNDLERLETSEGAWLCYRKQESGKPLHELLPPLIKKILQNLPFGKNMYWGEGKEPFVRPVHWLLLLHGDEHIPLELFGIKTATHTFGHRFYAKDPLVITHPREYEATLEQKGFVIPRFEKRRTIILDAFATVKIKGRVEQDNSLLDEVTSLTEWPVILTARFDKHFLKIPKEILISSMKQHQRCFPVFDKNGNLLPSFIIVSNTPTNQPKNIIQGNERVMRARLSDAEFFYQNDLKKPLESRLTALKPIIFQEKLGSLYEKSMRIASLAKTIAEHTEKTDPSDAYTAGKFAKADLCSEVVKEFPELQGVMGSYYAKNDGLPQAVALAIAEHYLPRTADDSLPTSSEGICLCIADRLDTLVGFFGIGFIPTGDKDPFGLRRAALAILRISLEKNWPLDLSVLIKAACALYKPFSQNPEELVLDFILERLRSWYAERGIPTNLVNAVLAKKPSCPVDFQARIEALFLFIKLPEAGPLIIAHKRINNILNKAGKEIAPSFSSAYLQDPAEKALAESLQVLQEKFLVWSEKKDYKEMLLALSHIKTSVDRFFDAVLVMTEDLTIQTNRLALLAQLRNLFTSVAEIALL